MFESKKEMEAHINVRLELYQKWKENDEPAYCLKEVAHWVRYGYRCEGLLEAVCNNFMGELEQEDFFKILSNKEKDLKEAYEMMMDGIEHYKKGRTTYGSE